MKFSDLAAFAADFVGDPTVLVRVGRHWHPVDAATIANDDGELVVRLEAADVAAEGGDES